MLKSELIALVNALRAENSLLRTQLEAAKANTLDVAEAHERLTRRLDPTPAPDVKAACARLRTQYPDRRSFSADEVRQACSA